MAMNVRAPGRQVRSGLSFSVAIRASGTAWDPEHYETESNAL